MFYKSTTALVTAGFLFAASGAAMAGDREYTRIDQLPEEGAVTVVGTVGEVSDAKEFILKDIEGNTIDVQSAIELTLKEGDRVRVIGVMDDDIAGMGDEINATSVTVVAASLEGTAEEGGKLLSKVAYNPDEGVKEFDTIDALPDEGMVTITGLVEEVDLEDNSFKLQGKSGESIDVHPLKPITVKKGQTVKVTGVMDDETLGLGVGEQIVSAKVVVVSGS
ncbi:MAG: hypothetical protein EP335_06715 [Alphaproteobacteria bacterium]|nr:MAG: hypothetical protein EP335_06715 [Alphaproteobacteria bacterium]